MNDEDSVVQRAKQSLQGYRHAESDQEDSSSSGEQENDSEQGESEDAETDSN